MNSTGIVSLRTALRYLRHGDDRAKRGRLACILAAGSLPALALAALAVLVGLALIT